MHAGGCCDDFRARQWGKWVHWHADIILDVVALVVSDSIDCAGGDAVVDPDGVSHELHAGAMCIKMQSHGHL